MALPLVPILLAAGVVTLVALSRSKPGAPGTPTDPGPVPINPTSPIYLSKLKRPPLNYPPPDLADKSDAGIIRSFQVNYNDGGYSVTFPVARPLQVNGILDNNTTRAIDEAIVFMQTRPDLQR